MAQPAHGTFLLKSITSMGFSHYTIGSLEITIMGYLRTTPDRPVFSTLVLHKRELLTGGLIFFLVAPAFMSAELLSVVIILFLIAWFVMSGFIIHRSLFPLIMPFIAIIALGIFGSLAHKPYDVVKDVWYVGKSVLSLVVGYLLMLHIRDLMLALRAMVLAATIVSVFHVVKLVIDPSHIGELFQSVPDEPTRGYFMAILGIGIVLALRRSTLIAQWRYRWILTVSLILCLIAVIFSVSRTLLLSLVIMFLVMRDYLKINNIIKLLVIFLMFVTAVNLFFVQPTIEPSGPQRSLLEKITLSPREIIIKDYRDTKEIMWHWRGFESYRALQTYLQGGVIEYTIGRGFGTLVDLGFYINLGGDYLRHIPILHNGYLYVLVKTGIIGFVLYVGYFISLMRYGTSLNQNGHPEDLRLIGKLIFAVCLILLVTTLVIAGFFNKSALLPVITSLGAFLAYGRMNSRPWTRIFPTVM